MKRGGEHGLQMGLSKNNLCACILSLFLEQIFPRGNKLTPIIHVPSTGAWKQMQLEQL